MVAGMSIWQILALCAKWTQLYTRYQRLSDNAEDLSKQITSLSDSVSSSADSLQAQQSTMCEKLDLMTDLLQQVITSNLSQKSSISKS